MALHVFSALLPRQTGAFGIMHSLTCGLRFMSAQREDNELSNKMVSIAESIQKIKSENDALKEAVGSEDYNFMPVANDTLRKMEICYGNECVGPIIETLQDPHFDGPAARLLIGSLVRLLPTRQSYFEAFLDRNCATWRVSLMNSTPQDPYSLEMKIAADASKTAEINQPQEVIDCIEKNLRSKYSDVVIETLRNCQRIGDVRLIEMCMQHVRSEDRAIRSAAILTGARLSVLDIKVQNFFRDFLYSNASIEEKNNAFEAFMDVFPSDGESVVSAFIRDPALKELVFSPDFLNNILDLPRVDLKKVSEQLIQHATISSLPDTSLRRIARSSVLDSEISLAAMTAIEEKDRKDSLLAREQALPTSRFGLLAQRDGKLWIGHCGIFISADTQMIDATTGRGSHAVHEISFSRWKNKEKCWGIRDDAEHTVDLAKAVATAKKIASWRTEYDGNHMNQKGEWFKGWFCRPKYWETDCVGFTEYCYEQAGTHRGHYGWLITPRNQRDHMRKVFDC